MSTFSLSLDVDASAASVHSKECISGHADDVIANDSFCSKWRDPTFRWKIYHTICLFAACASMVRICVILSLSVSDEYICIF